MNTLKKISTIGTPNRLKIFFKDPVLPTLLLALVLLFLSLYEAGQVRPFNSDDVSWQNILMTWSPFGGNITLGGSDNFIIKVPLFLLLSKFFEPSRKLLFVESYLLAASTFILFFYSSIYFLKSQSAKITFANLLPLLWFASFGYSFAQLYLNPILRNIEIGLSYILFALIAAFFYKKYDAFKSRQGRMLFVIVSVISGLLIYNDPYFLYFTILPIALFTSVLLLQKFISYKQAITIFLGVILSLAAYKLIGTVSIIAGVNQLLPYPISFISYGQLFSHISLTFQSLLTIFNANFWGGSLFNIQTLSNLSNFILLIYICLKIYRYLRSFSRNSQNKIWQVFFSSLFVFVLIVYTVSSLAIDLNTYRYLVIDVFAGVLVLSTSILDMRNIPKNILLVLLILSTLLNVSVSYAYDKYRVGTSNASNKANSQNYLLINYLNASGYTKGYAPYWDSHINSYLSKGHISFLPIACLGNKTVKYYWLIDNKAFSKPADRSFYLYDPSSTSPPTCSINQIKLQFGLPVKTVKLNNYIVYFYNYDIVQQM